MRFITALAAVLVLAGGCAVDTDTTTTTDRAPLATLALASDGLGDIQFGLDPDTVIAAITDRFGAPDLDSEWIPATANQYGTCPGELMRAIGWGSLVAIFIDDASSDLGGWFYTYTYGYDYNENMGGIDPRELNLVTADGIGIGSTLDDLQAAFGTALVVTGDEELDIWSFAAEAPGFRGLLSGGDPEATVTLFEPVEGCG